MRRVGKHEHPGCFYDWQRKADAEQENEENIFPPSMTDREALEILTHYLLGDDWIVVDPLSYGQVNTMRVYDILCKHSREFREERERVIRRWQRRR